MQFPEWYKEAERLYVEENLPYYKIVDKLNLCRKTISKWLRIGGHQSNSKYARTIVWSKSKRKKIHEFKHSDIKRVQFFGEDAQRVLKEMYENATVYLDRKYALYQKHVSPSKAEML